MKKYLKLMGFLAGLYLCLNILTPYLGFLHQRSITNQINYLGNKLDHGYDDDLQKRYPEGKIFSNALFALALIDNANKKVLSNKKHSTLVDNCIKRLIADTTCSLFSTTTNIKYGAFYNGWINFVLSKYKQSMLYDDSNLKSSINKKYNEISQRIINSQIDSLLLLETYHESIWPADNIICLISLDQSNRELKERWLKAIEDLSFHEHQLIHHYASDRINPRGSSSALITYFISSFDNDKGYVYNKKFSKQFNDNYLGIELVLEFLSSDSAKADIDSGPVIFNYGSVATIMNVKTQAQLGNKRSKNTWSFLNMISFPLNIFNRKFYLFQQEMMFDLFMLWCAVEL